MPVVHQTRQTGKDRKITGGKYKKWRGVKAREIGRLPTLTAIGNKKIKVQRTKGGGLKAKVLRSPTANVLDKKTGKYVQAAIKLVKENSANRQFVRQNIITKGALIETEIGLARVTSRPGQHGTINAVLVEKKG